VSWVPVDACTLPTPEQPLRAAEFDALFADALLAVEIPDATTAVLRLAPGSAARATDLAARETACCSFFAFVVREHDDRAVVVTVTVPPEHADVLAGLAVRACALLPSAL
jgi:hypothetical protein